MSNSRKYTYRLPKPLSQTLQFGYPADMDRRYPNGIGLRFIYDAIVLGHYAKLRWLLKLNHIDLHDSYVENSLNHAVTNMWSNNESIAALLSELGINPDPGSLGCIGNVVSMISDQNINMQCYLRSAATYGHIDTIKTLAEQCLISEPVWVTMLSASQNKFDNFHTLQYIRRMSPSSQVHIIPSKIQNPAELQEVLTNFPRGPHTFYMACYDACRVGNMHYMKWILGEPSPITLPVPEYIFTRLCQVGMYTVALDHGRLEILRLLSRHFTKPDLCSDHNDEFMRIEETGTIWDAPVEVVAPIVSLLGFNHQMCMIFARHGNIRVLRWALDEGYLQPLLCEEFRVTCGSLEVLELIANIGMQCIAHVSTWQEAITRCDMRVLQWLERHKNHPKISIMMTPQIFEDLITYMFNDGQVRMIEWAIRHGWAPGIMETKPEVRRLLCPGLYSPKS